MKKRCVLLGAVGLLALAGCGDKGGDAPKGQVVATVGGEDITVHELNAELQATPNSAGHGPQGRRADCAAEHRDAPAADAGRARAQAGSEPAVPDAAAPHQ
jgi:predicted small lipoprotein YifL